MRSDSSPPLRLAAAALLLAGCYASSAVDDGASGTRLRRVMLVPDDGEPVAVGWHDLELGEDCSFLRTEDGRTRCVPRGWLGPEYEDPDCTRRLVNVGGGLCGDLRFATDLVFPDGCGEMPPFVRLYELDEEVVSVERAYARTREGCVALEGPRERVRRGAAVDPSRFVAIETVEVVDTGGPITRGRFVTEDGATGSWGPRDRSRDAACSLPYVMHLDRQPCLPRRSAEARAWGTCDEVWARLRAECTVPELAWRADLDECGVVREAHVYAVDAEVPAGELAACGVEPGDRLYHRTRPADDAVAWMTRSWRGEGRLQLATWSDVDGREVLSSWRFRDTELGFTCVPWQTTDGIRCVPDWVGENGTAPAPDVASHYADPACTERAAGYRPCGTSFAASWTDGGCEATMDGVYRVEGPLDRVYRRDASGECAADESTEGHALTPIPLASLARLERVIE